MKMPMAPERRIVRQYFSTSLDARDDGIDLVEDMALTAGPRMACSTSATPKAPTSAGNRPMPPARSVQPKAKRW